MKMIFASSEVIKRVWFDVVFTTRQPSSTNIWWSFLFFTEDLGAEEEADIYLYFGTLFAEEVDDDEDETPDVKRRRVIYVASSDEEEANEEPSEEPKEPSEEEANEEPSEEDSVLGDEDYYDPANCPACYQHFLYECECLPPLPPRSDDEIRMQFAGQWV